jgi:hypothetical protein
MKRLTLICAALAGTAACTSTPQVVPSRDFDRPTDMAFVCVGISGGTDTSDGGDGGDGGDDAADAAPGPMQVIGQPMTKCHPSPSDPNSRTFALVVNSDRSTVSVLDLDHNKLIDLDPTTAGFNEAPLGLLPEQIAASDDGCRMLTPNQGSGDFSFIDPAVLLTPVMASQQHVDLSAAQQGAGPSTFAQTIPSPVGAPPGEVQFLTTTDAPCSRDKTYQTLVTFPSCNLIALMEFPSGRLIDSVSVNPTDGTVTSQGANPSCSFDCAPPAGDGGAPDGGGTPSHCAQPTGIAIRPDGERAYVGLADAPFITVLDLRTPNTLTGATPIVLNEGAIGSDRIRLSVDPFLSSGAGKSGSFVGEDVAGDRRYLYVAARDGTLRVVQVANLVSATEQECDTNADPQHLPPGFDQNTACLPVDAVSVAHRRPSAIGPGIRLPSPVRDVAAIDLNRKDAPPLESDLNGDYAFVMTQNGLVYIVNIAPRPRPYGGVVNGVGKMTVNGGGTDVFTEGQVNPPPSAATLFVNALRDVNVLSFSRTLDSTTGPPRLDVPALSSGLGPRFQNFWATDTSYNGEALPSTCGPTPVGDGGLATTCPYLQTQVFFPDATAVNPQQWSVIWQGPLSNVRFSGQIGPSPAPSPTPTGGNQLIDRGVDFCALETQRGDIVTLSGCVTNQQCGAGKVCVHGTGAPQAAGNLPVNGICLDNAAQASQAIECAEFLDTIKRYEVVSLTSTPGSRILDAVEIRPHLDQLVRPVPCTDATASSDGGARDAGDGGSAPDAGDAGSAPDAAAASDAGAGGDGGAPSPPVIDCTDLSDPGAKFVCRAGHCLMPCTKPTDCRPGRICERSPGTLLDGTPLPDAKYCSDAPAAIPTDCFDQLTAYQVNVGGGFVVSGSVTSYPLQHVTDQGANPLTCRAVNPDPLQSANPPQPGRLIRRIPVFPTPQCTNTPNISDLNGDLDPMIAGTTNTAIITNKDIDKNDPNAMKTFLNTKPNPNPCRFLAGPNDSGPTQHWAAFYRNTELAFMLTNLEQVPSGNLEIDFAVHGGFRAQTVVVPADVEVDLPARIMVSPIDIPAVPGNRYVFVVDQRKLGRAQGGGPTRGQILRMNPTYTPNTTTGAYPVFEDYNLSSGYYPIQ